MLPFFQQIVSITDGFCLNFWGHAVQNMIKFKMMPQLLYLNTGIFISTKVPQKTNCQFCSCTRNLHHEISTIIQYRTHRIKRTSIKQLNNHHWRKSIKFPVLTTKIVIFLFCLFYVKRLQNQRTCWRQTQN